LLSLIASSLFLEIIDLSHLKMSAVEEHANNILCFLLYRSPSETLQMFEEASGKAAMKQMQIYGWHNIAMQVSMMIHAAGNTLGLIHYEFISEVNTVNKEMYVEILHHLRGTVRRKHPEKWVQNSWYFLHCTCMSTNHNVAVLEHPPYFLNLPPPSFFLFP
jgi:hypothetical protein